MTYDPHYEGSSVVFGQSGSACSAHGTHSFKARPGHHLPSRLLSNGQNVFEKLGRDFTLLAFGHSTDDPILLFRQASASLGVPLTVVQDSYSEGREAYESRLILVRPDHYIAWCSSDAPQDTMAVLAKCGRP
jgi:hypothetical protein